MMWWNHDGWGWFWMTAAMVGFWALVIAVVVAFVRGGSANGQAAPGAGVPSRRPEEILAERLARGEIAADEYHARLDALRGPSRV